MSIEMKAFNLSQVIIETKYWIENIGLTTLYIDQRFLFQELQASANLLVQARSGLLSGLEEQKAVADSEARERSSILGKFRNMEHQVSD